MHPALTRGHVRPGLALRRRLCHGRRRLPHPLRAAGGPVAHPPGAHLSFFQSFALDGAPLVQTCSLLGGLNPRPHRWPRSSRRRRAPRTSRTLGSARRLRSKTRWTGPRILRLRILRLPSWSNTQSGQLHVAVAACGESCDGGLCRYQPAQKAVRLLKIDF